MTDMRGANTFSMSKRLPNPFSQTVDHSLSFFVFLTFSLNKHWWRFHSFGKQFIYLSILFRRPVVAHVATIAIMGMLIDSIQDQLCIYLMVDQVINDKLFWLLYVRVVSSRFYSRR